MKKDIHERMEGQRIKTYSFIKQLGSGAWAIVYEGIDQKNGNQIAIKAVPKFLMKQTPKLSELIQTEIKVLKQCVNQNVVRYVDNFMSDRTIFIAMQYCNGGDLDEYLEKKKRLTQDEATRFLKQILNGFTGLHKVKAMHRDFKLANVLLHQGVCKIADLGFAKQMEKKLTNTILGTSLTMAPQILEEKSYGLQADLWSVGVVYYQMLYGKYPFSGYSDFEILKRIKSTKADFSGVNISSNAKNFIEKCLTVDPTQRIAWAQVYNHPLIKEQQKMAYGFASKIKISQNQDVYKQQFQVDQNLRDADRKQVNFKKKSFEPIFQEKQYKAQIVNAQSMQVIKKKNQQKKKIDLTLQQYSKQYLNRRNNIMFIFKFVTPYIYNLYNINANHGITLFIVCKKAYQDMRAFMKLLQNKVNFLKLNLYFNEFINSNSYTQIVNMIRTDIEMILVQIQTYKEDINVNACNKDIKNQFNVEKIYNSKWEEFVKQMINSYEFQLGDALDFTVDQEKRDLIKVIEALIFYKQNTQNADIQVFDRKIQNLNYEQQELVIRNRLTSLLKWE